MIAQIIHNGTIYNVGEVTQNDINNVNNAFNEIYGNMNTVNNSIANINDRLNTMNSNFTDGCNQIVQAVTSKGVTPASNSLNDITTAIGSIPTGISLEYNYYGIIMYKCIPGSVSGEYYRLSSLFSISNNNGVLKYNYVGLSLLGNYNFTFMINNVTMRLSVVAWRNGSNVHSAIFVNNHANVNIPANTLYIIQNNTVKSAASIQPDRQYMLRNSGTWYAFSGSPSALSTSTFGYIGADRYNEISRTCIFAIK